MSKENPITWVCKSCGSEDVCVGAYAMWDKVRQNWDFELSDHTDDDMCLSCGGGEVTEKAITDLKYAALVAINNQAKSSEDQHDNSVIC